MESDFTYQNFLSTKSKPHWEKIGIKKRAGVIIPLFSLHSKNSSGIGEFTDLLPFSEWCLKTGLSIIQLLPLNDVGFSFMPYDAQSTFALDPMYLNLNKLTECEIAPFKKEIRRLREEFPLKGLHINFDIKKAKLELLWKIFQNKAGSESKSFIQYRESNSYWLQDYALFKVIKELNQDQGWQDWPEKLKHRDPETLASLNKDHSKRIEFYCWLQYQIFSQFTQVKQEISKQGVFIVGDLPFLVSRDSADVWAHQDYFKLEFSAGAPPDLYFAAGQRWGMPPYRWENIASHNYDYLIQKLKYAEHFYDMHRIDHFVGIFRVWTIPLSEPEQNAGLHGTYDPQDESVWEEHGLKLLNVMLENSTMLPIAEDLGTIPPCSFKVIEESGILGTDIQRWSKDWGKTYDFKAPETYRKHSVTTITTHDMMHLTGWWALECGTVDEVFFKRLCEKKSVDFESIKPKLFDLSRSKYNRLRWKDEIENQDVLLQILNLNADNAFELIDSYQSTYREQNKFWSFLCLNGQMETKPTVSMIGQALLEANKTASIFSIQLIHDWLSLDQKILEMPAENIRINYPGTLSKKNWSLIFPYSIEELLKLKINPSILKLNHETGRA